MARGRRRRSSQRDCGSTHPKNSTTTNTAESCNTYCGNSQLPTRRLKIMTLTMHQATVSTCSRALNSLAAILEKAVAYAEARKIDPAVLLNTRLAPDMLPLS